MRVPLSPAKVRRNNFFRKKIHEYFEIFEHAGSWKKNNGTKNMPFNRFIISRNSQISAHICTYPHIQAREGIRMSA